MRWKGDDRYSPAAWLPSWRRRESEPNRSRFVETVISSEARNLQSTTHRWRPSP